MAEHYGVIDWRWRRVGLGRYTAAIYQDGQPERLGLRVVSRHGSMPEAQREADRLNDRPERSGRA